MCRFQRVANYIAALAVVTSCGPRVHSPEANLKYQDQSIQKISSQQMNSYVLYLSDLFMQKVDELAEVYFDESQDPAVFPECNDIDGINKFIHADALFKTSYDDSLIVNSLNSCIAAEESKPDSKHLYSLLMLRLKHEAKKSIFAAKKIINALTSKNQLRPSLVAYSYLLGALTMDEINSLPALSKEDKLLLTNYLTSINANQCLDFENDDSPVSIAAFNIEDGSNPEQSALLLKESAINYCILKLNLANRFDDQIVLTALQPTYESLFTYRLSMAVMSQESIEYFQKFYEVLSLFLNEYTAPNLAYAQASPYDFSIMQDVICKDKFIASSNSEELATQFDRIHSDWWLNHKAAKDTIAELDQFQTDFGQKEEVLLLKASIAMFAGDMQLAAKTYGESIKLCPYNAQSFENISTISKFIDYQNGTDNIFTYYAQQASKISSSDGVTFDRQLMSYLSGYSQLNDFFKKIVVLKVNGWAPFLPSLVDAGKRAIIKTSHIPNYMASHDLQNFPYAGGSRWGRFYYDEDLRNVETVAGIAYENDIVVNLQTFLTKDTLEHEIAHQVHLGLFTTELQQCITNLYEQAKMTNQFVSAYGSTDEREYFAESMTAYFLQGDVLEYRLDSAFSKTGLQMMDPKMHEFAANIIASQGDISKIECPSQ